MSKETEKGDRKKKFGKTGVGGGFWNSGDDKGVWGCPENNLGGGGRRHKIPLFPGHPHALSFVCEVKKAEADSETQPLFVCKRFLVRPFRFEQALL